jgi:hypothetical protein
MFNKFSERIVSPSSGSGGVGVPDGGTTGQHLSKASDADGDVIWEAPPTVDLSDYAYLPGRSGGQLLHGGTGVDDALVLQGTTANATATTDTVKIVSGNDGSIDSIRVRGDGGVLIGEGDRYGYGYGRRTCREWVCKCVMCGG